MGVAAMERVLGNASDSTVLLGKWKYAYGHEWVDELSNQD